jgi:hypothetical protein
MRSAVFNGIIADARGPFFNSGNWWENNRWWREEWDIEAADGSLYRIFRPAGEIDDHNSSPKSGGPMPLSLETDERAQSFQSLPPSQPLLLQYFIEGVYD